MDSEKQAATPALTTTTTSAAELLQAQAELWCHTYGYLKSTALRCAIKLGIPDAVSRCGGAASLSELHAVLPVPPSKRPCLSRLMRFLAATGILAEDIGTTPVPAHEAGADERRYRLTAVSRLLVADGDSGGHAPCLSPFAASALSPCYFPACLRLPEWLETEEDGNDGGAAPATTPFVMAHGTDLWGMVGRDAKFGASFNEAMGSGSRFVAPIVVRECGEVFAGVESLVDVGGGDGTMAKAVAEAFPRVRCSVLELPQVVERITPPPPADGDGGGNVEFVAGDMMEFIPPADALLLKFILHDWSDEDCVRILKRCKDAVSSRESKGKLIIIDTVVGSTSNPTLLEAQLLMDLSMMVLVTGKERDEEQWSRLFVHAGFARYKISPVLGCCSLIEVYP